MIPARPSPKREGDDDTSSHMHLTVTGNISFMQAVRALCLYALWSVVQQHSRALPTLTLRFSRSMTYVRHSGIASKDRDLAWALS